MQNKYMCKIVHKCTKTRDKKAKVWDSFVFFWMHRSDKKNTGEIDCSSECMHINVYVRNISSYIHVKLFMKT